MHGYALPHFEVRRYTMPYINPFGTWRVHNTWRGRDQEESRKNAGKIRFRHRGDRSVRRLNGEASRQKEKLVKANGETSNVRQMATEISGDD